MKKKAIYIAVGKPEATQSSLWRIWNEKEEIYILARGEAGMVYKLSLHSSGISRLAYLPEKEIKDPLIIDNDPRLIWRWKPKEYLDGWDRRLDIIVPAISVKEPFSIEKSIGTPKDQVTWLETLPLGYRQQITVLVADSISQKVDDILIKGDTIAGSLTLNNGKIVWVRTRQEKLMLDFQERVENFANDMKINYDKEENPDSDELFATMIEVDKDSSHPVITNYALGWDHVFVKGSKYKRPKA